MVTQSDMSGHGRTIAVFGASGHTGRFMVAQLLRRGFAPLAIGRDSKVGLSQEQLDGWLESSKQRIPLGRIGQPEEVAITALFLAAGASFTHRGGDLRRWGHGRRLMPQSSRPAADPAARESSRARTADLRLALCPRSPPENMHATRPDYHRRFPEVDVSNRQELPLGTAVDSGSQSTVSTILPVCSLRSMYW